MTRRAVSFLALVSVALLTSGCFDVEERLEMKRDGSGHYQMAFDFSSAKEDLEFILQLMEREAVNSEEEFVNPLEEFRRGFEEMAGQVSYTVGVSNAESFYDEERIKVGVRFDFVSMESLNEALSTLYSSPAYEFEPFYRFVETEKTLYRDAAFYMAPLFEGFLEDPESNQFSDMVKNSRYQFVLIAPKKVKAFGSDKAALSADGKELSYSTATVGELIEGRASGLQDRVEIR